MNPPTDRRILGLIPARGGSKGIPGKNIAPLCGSPLIAYTIEAALESRTLGRIVLTSDSPEIMEVARRYGAETPFRRPAELARDDTPMLPVIHHAVTQLRILDDYRPDLIVLLQPTSPLRTARHIDEAVRKLADSDADSIVSVVEIPHRYSPVSAMEIRSGHLVPCAPMDEAKHLRQCKPVYYARNGAAIYAFTRACLMEKNSIYGDRILPYLMPPEASVDIDDPLDLKICRMLLQERLKKRGAHP